LTYLYGCGLAVAVIEQIEEKTFNPNVALEIGYMLAQRKPVCFLKEKKLEALHSDLIGKLYRDFDSHALQTLTKEIQKWLDDR
jgi:nucleoside 2-deoxyribosyltransferase